MTSGLVPANTAASNRLIPLASHLCKQDAQRALEDCLRDEPQWRGLLRVEEIELSDTSPTRN